MKSKREIVVTTPRIHDLTLKVGAIQTLTLLLHGYGQVTVVGGQRAVKKLQEVLEALDFEVEIE